MVWLGEGGWEIFRMGEGGKSEGIFPSGGKGWAFRKCSPGFVELHF